MSETFTKGEDYTVELGPMGFEVHGEDGEVVALRHGVMAAQSVVAFLRGELAECEPASHGLEYGPEMICPNCEGRGVILPAL